MPGFPSRLVAVAGADIAVGCLRGAACAATGVAPGFSLAFSKRSVPVPQERDRRYKGKRREAVCIPDGGTYARPAVTASNNEAPRILI